MEGQQDLFWPLPQLVEGMVRLAPGGEEIERVVQALKDELRAEGAPSLTSETLSHGLNLRPKCLSGLALKRAI